MSVAALNFYLDQTNKTINQIAAARDSVAQLSATAHNLERVALSQVYTQLDALMAGEPALQTQKIVGSSNPILQILDTTGAEQYRVTLPTRTKLQNCYFTYLSGSGFNPSSEVDANAYLQQVQAILPTQTNETQNFAVVELMAENVERQIPPLFDQLHIVSPPLREWLQELAWEAGDGDDRARELFANAVIAFLMSVEIDDYSPPGQVLTQQRALLRTADNNTTPTSPTTDLANSLLDELNGNTDTTGLTDCFVPLSPAKIATNKAKIGKILRHLPTLSTPAGVAEAAATVTAVATDPDILNEVAVELTPKNTPQDPVFLAIQAAAQYAVNTYHSSDPTQLLLDVEQSANSFLTQAQAIFGATITPQLLAAVQINPDNRLSGIRRREGLVALREGLVPTIKKASYDEVSSLLWMLANLEIDTNLLTQSIYDSYLQVLADYTWMFKAFVDRSFLTSADRTNALAGALAAILADLTQVGTLITTADIGTFTDALRQLESVAITPEDRKVQFDRIRDIGQRFSNFADVETFRFYVNILVGGGYLADVEYQLNYRTLLMKATQATGDDPLFLAGELMALGNLGFTASFANQLLAELNTITNDALPQLPLAQLEAIGLPARLGAAGTLLDAYWTGVVAVSSRTILKDAIVLSRDLNTWTGTQRSTAIAADNLALTRLTGIPDPRTTADIYNALVTYTKPPYVQAQETDFLNNIIQGNPVLQAAWIDLTTKVTSAVSGAPPDIAHYPLIIFAKQTIYQTGLVIKAACVAVQGGRVVSQLGNSLAIVNGDPTTPQPYVTYYYPQGCSDVVTHCCCSPVICTFSGEQPSTGFVSATLTSTTPYTNYTPDITSSAAQSDFSQSLSSSGGSSGGDSGGGGFSLASLQNAICKVDTLFNMINQLNGITNAVTGAINGGINNAIGAVNSTISGLVGQLTSLIQGVGNMGSMNIAVNCTCLKFDLSVNLQNLLKPITSWLTNFGNMLQLKNPFGALKNPFLLNPALGCPQGIIALGQKLLGGS